MTLCEVILPYWERPAALELFLDAYHHHHRAMDLVITVIDDGSTRFPARDVLKVFPWDLRVDLIELPKKVEPKNPCVPYNVGIEASESDYLVLTNPECIPQKPILLPMIEEMRKWGKTTYVVASCWCPDDRRGSKWLHHSRIVCQPWHYCTMGSREHFLKVGGFDNDFRDGRASEDIDWVRTLVTNDTHLVFRDDLVVNHYNFAQRGTGMFPPDSLRTNGDIYGKKWPEGGLYKDWGPWPGKRRVSWENKTT